MATKHIRGVSARVHSHRKLHVNLALQLQTGTNFSVVLLRRGAPKRYPNYSEPDEALPALDEAERYKLLKGWSSELNEKEDDELNRIRLDRYLSQDHCTRVVAMPHYNLCCVYDRLRGNCCNCGTKKNKLGDCSSAKCACWRNGIGCQKEGTLAQYYF